MSVPIAPNGAATAITYATQYMDHCGQSGAPRDPCTGWSIGQLQTYAGFADPSVSTAGNGGGLRQYAPLYFDSGLGYNATRGFGPGLAVGTYYTDFVISSGGYAFHMAGALKGDGSLDTGVYTGSVPPDFVFSQLGISLPLTYVGTRSTTYSYQLCWPGGTFWCAVGNQPASVRRSPR